MQERDELLLMVNGSGEPDGHLRITCSISLGERLVVPTVRRFSEAHPRLTVTMDLSNHLVDIVGEGFDLAIRTGEIADPRLVGRQIALRPISTCASPDYLKSTGEPESIADLQTRACLIGTSTTWHFKVGEDVINFSPKGRWRCNNGPAIVDAALAGMGICQLPLFYVQEHQAAGRLVSVLTSFQPASEPIWAVYPARRHLTPKVRNLVDLLERELQAALDGQPVRGPHPARL
jgi:DNA-binding transcriptional LysR family regulator